MRTAWSAGRNTNIAGEEEVRHQPRGQEPPVAQRPEQPGGGSLEERDVEHGTQHEG
jgi:hypothetical protein